MLEIIFIILLLIGLVGMGAIIYIKIPVLAELDLDRIEPFTSDKKEGKTGILKLFSLRWLLHKLLSKIRILILKSERKTDSLLARLRQKSVKSGNDKFSNDYWQDIKRKK